MTLQQLPLGFRLRDDATFASFLPGDNAQVLQAALNLVRGIGDNFIYIWAAIGAGRSHLLQAICHAAPEYNASAVYLTLEDPNSLLPDSFVGLENVNLVCLDDIEKISGNSYWEEQLFHLFNRIRTNNNRLIVTANVPPTSLEIKLPDLKSRLAWGTVYQMHLLNDEQKLAALQLRAHGRGLDLDSTVGKFLLRRCPRNMAELFSTLEQLDQASLAKQRRLTIPFVKEELGV
jgi:DnaA family protein